MNAPVYAFRPDGSLMDLTCVQDSDIRWRWIAKALSVIPRFNGLNPVGAYSVAQHCVMGADAVANETGNSTLAGFFLLHDAHEAYIGDWTRPTISVLSQAFTELFGVPAGWMDEAVHRVKSRIDAQIFTKAGLPVIGLPGPLPQPARDMDERMLQAEALALFGSKPPQYGEDDLRPPKLTGAIKPWGALKAEEAWLDRLTRHLGIDWRAEA